MTSAAQPRRDWQRHGPEPTRRWTVGRVTITKVGHLVLEAGLDAPVSGEFLGDATRDVLLGLGWMVPDFATPAGDVRLCFHSFVIETPTRRIVVDTGVGNDRSRPLHPFWDELDLPFLRDLDAAGYPPDTIDTVVNTHLHIDHVGWNTQLTDGRWTPTFPRARYLLDRAEHEFWAERAAAGPDGSSLHPAVFWDDSVEPLFAAGAVDLVGSGEVAVCDEVRLVSSAGHTPGHRCVRIDSDGASALITGDAVHHPIQLVHPDWTLGADVDRDAARDARWALLDGLAGSDTLVLGTHWGGRSAGRLVREGAGFRLE